MDVVPRRDAAGPVLRIRLTRRSDGAVLHCTRADGSVAWQRQEGRQGAFFPLHDLTHYAVESALGTRYGFFGLVAAGWEIDDTTGKGARGPLPPAAVVIERIVGLLDVERASGGVWSAADFAEQLVRAGVSPDEVPAALTDETLDHVRARRAALLARWAAVCPGASLELEFGGTPVARG